MKISVSLPQELVQYIDDRVGNRSKLIESLLITWQKNQQRESMAAACLVLDEQQFDECSFSRLYPSSIILENVEIGV